MSRYVEIQKARFGERLRVTVSRQRRRAATRAVPALLLQPLVENAIRHGLAARLDAGRIDIDARVDSGPRWSIDVVDDGAGDGAIAGRHGTGRPRQHAGAARGAVWRTQRRSTLAPSRGPRRRA